MTRVDMTFLSRLKTHLVIPPHFLHMNENELQNKLAPQLRSFAVDYLRNPSIKTPLTTGFRGEFLPHHVGEHYQAYLNRQSKDKEWGSYIEATVFGEAFGCNFFVTPIPGVKEQNPICLHYAGKDAPIIHLYNHSNAHWSVGKRPNSTIGDGNCLYNALAQALRAISRLEEPQTNLTASNITFYKKDPKEDILHQSIIQAQKDIYKKLKLNNYLTPEQNAEQLKQEALRIRRLPKMEQEQITQDYLFALKIAQEDLSYIKHPIHPCFQKPSHHKIIDGEEQATLCCT